MSFQAYLATILAKTGKTPEEIYEIAAGEGILKENLKATEFKTWLADRFGLGHGHSMALWKYFVDKNWIQTTHTTLK